MLTGDNGWRPDSRRRRLVHPGPDRLTLMGVRLYNPVTGRFLSVDPLQIVADNARNVGRCLQISVRWY